MAALPVFLVLCLAATGLGEPLHKRIINGNHAEPGSHPYIVYVLTEKDRKFYQCGGTLISRGWVLTAAHCLMHNGRPVRSKNIEVRMGILNYTHTSNVNTQIDKAAYTVIHPGYKDDYFKGTHNDIALIRLSTPATLNNNVKIASLAEQGADFLGEECVLAGWGLNSTRPRQSPHWLHEVEITVISTSECKAHWIRALKKEHGTWVFDYIFGGDENFSQFTEKHICVHDDTPPQGSRPSACSGDSGGPMMCGSGHNVLAGVTSWGESTCSGTLPSVYTRVSAYRDWIYQYARV